MTTMAPRVVAAVALSLALSAALGAAADPTTIPRACVAPHDSYGFCNASLPLDARLDDLIGRLTLDEKPYLLVARESPLGNISRLGIPEYDWGLNCIHGVQSTCTKDGVCPTSFPDPNTLGASFNRSVWRGMGAVIGTETRSLWLQGIGEDHLPSGLPHMGLDCWSPNIGIVRDPRWGRNLETPSEDPLICGTYGTEYTLGLQNGTDPRFFQGLATLKHFDANSLEGTWGPYHNITRHTFDAMISMYDLHSTYLPAFKQTVMEGGAGSVMCSYNAINGVPSCANKWLLQDTLRDAWGFTGVVTSDSGAVVDVLASHHYVDDADHMVAATISAGCDIESAPWKKNQPWATGGPYITNIPEAVGKGLLNESQVDEALRHALGMRFRLGLFDPIDDQPYWHVPPSVVREPAHVALAKDATLQGLVLLKNGQTTVDGASVQLPFKAGSGSKVAVVGPHANDRSVTLGNYIGEICPDNTDDCVQTPYEAIAARNGVEMTCNQTGVAVNSTDGSGIAAAVSCAADSDWVIYIGGLDSHCESEGKDRPDIGLPGLQPELLTKLYATGKPVAIVLYNGGIITMSPDIIDGATAIVGAGYPGFYAAEALASALFEGSQTNPSMRAANRWGKTAVTWYSEAGWAKANFDMLSFDMALAPGRTYRYYDASAEPPQWPFGFGLSYTSMDVAAQGSGDMVKVSVTNNEAAGGRDGDEVVLAYFTAAAGVIPSSEPASAIQRQLFDFARVGPVHAGTTDTSTTFQVTPEALTLHDSTGAEKFFPGDYDIIISTGVKEVTVKLSCTATACMAM